MHYRCYFISLFFVLVLWFAYSALLDDTHKCRRTYDAESRAWALLFFHSTCTHYNHLRCFASHNETAGK